MELLTGILAMLVVIAILYDLARRIGVPYPTLLVLGGLALAFIPGLPRIELQPNLVLLVFLPPLLFQAAVGSPTRDLKTNLAPLLRLSIGLVLFTMVVVAAVAHAVIPGLDWAPAFALGAIVAPTDALAATSVFRRIGAPRLVVTLVEGESLFNDATALVSYRTAVLAVGGTFVLEHAFGTFVVAAVGGIAVGVVVGWLAAELLRRLDNPPVEVALSFVVPFAAYLPAEQLQISGVLAAVTAGLIIGSRLGTILTPNSRVLWLTSWKMIGFILNGYVFVLIGLALPGVIGDLGGRTPMEIIALGALVSAVVIVARILWAFASGFLPGSPRRRVAAATNTRLANRLTFVVGWAGLRGAVSLAAALALPASFPERNVIILITFAVILVTLVGQGLSLPYVIRWAGWDGTDLDGDEPTVARTAAYQAGLDEIARAREKWPGHLELIDRLESGLQDRTRHLATADAAETAERRQERAEHEEIQRGVIGAQRTAVIELRDQGEINDDTLRLIERELDLEELRMEG